MLIKIYAAATLIMSVITFAAFGNDKKKAKRSMWRTPEAVLLTLSLLGGSIGALAGMRFFNFKKRGFSLFHHKTRKPKFIILVPLTLIIWAALGVLLVKTSL